MIQKITIENFKVFDFVEIEGFSRINVFVGANDSGKTSLLEAIFLSLAPNNPDLLFKTLLFRDFFLKTDNVDSIFHNFNQNTPIKIIMQDNQNTPFVLQIEASSQQNKQIKQLETGENLSAMKLVNKLTFKSKVNNHEEIESKIEFLVKINGSREMQETQITAPVNYPFKLGAFIPIENLALNDLVANINNIRKNKATQNFIKCLQIFNPHIIDVEVNGTSVYVNLDNKSKLLDIRLMGTGFKKYVTILSTIFSSSITANNADCLYICIDEIENGLYFKNCEKLLESLIDLGRKMNIQYFFTTHSLEFLDILRRVSEKMDFKEQAIFQIKETKKGIKAYQYSFEESPYFNLKQLDPRN